jgi:hypothetical protein
MGGLFLIGFLIVLLAKLWPFLLAALALAALWCFVVMSLRKAEEREARDQLRHARARQEIDRIAAATAQAMVEAAREHGR